MISRKVRCASVAFWKASNTFFNATTSLWRHPAASAATKQPQQGLTTGNRVEPSNAPRLFVDGFPNNAVRLLTKCSMGSTTVPLDPEQTDMPKRNGALSESQEALPLPGFRCTRKKGANAPKRRHAYARSRSAEVTAQKQKPRQAGRALTPLPSLDTISYFRRTCLSISSDMVRACREGWQHPSAGRRGQPSTALPSQMHAPRHRRRLVAVQVRAC